MEIPVLLFFKTAVTLTYESTEDVRVIRKNAEKIKRKRKPSY